MEFTAVIQGKVVTYPKDATFIIERKKGKKAYGILGVRDTLSQALTKVTSAHRQGHKVRLSACFEGHVKPLVRF